MSLLRELQKKNFKEAVEKEGSILSIIRSLELKKKEKYKLYRFLKNGNCADVSLIVSISRYVNLKIKREIEKGPVVYNDYSIFLPDFSGKKEMTALRLGPQHIIHLEKEYAQILMRANNWNLFRNDAGKKIGEKNESSNTSRNSKKTRTKLSRGRSGRSGKGSI